MVLYNMSIAGVRVVEFGLTTRYFARYMQYEVALKNRRLARSVDVAERSSKIKIRSMNVTVAELRAQPTIHSFTAVTTIPIAIRKTNG